MRIFQKGFNYSQDGPGNRLVYHLQGCNFKCIWCSNPEGMGAKCDKTKEYTVPEIVKEVKRSKIMFFDGGGVTFTGGEATLQFDELKEILSQLKEAGINTAIETNGSHIKLPELSEYVDYLIMDVKHIDREKHFEFIKAYNDETLENFKILSGQRALHVRIPLINNFNSEDGKRFAEFFKKFGGENNDYEILPYHEYGKCKYTGEYLVKDGFVTERQIEIFEGELKSAGLKVIRT